MSIRSVITSTGSYLPKKFITNFDLSKTVETSDEWIFERTGIKQRHIADDNEMTSDIASKAALEALNKAKINPSEIDLIVLATTTPDLTFPSTATIVQSKIKAINAFAFDLQAVCSGFVFAVSTADSFIKSGRVKKALVIGADILSRIVDWKDRNTCVLFGDGAGAVIIESSLDQERGIIAWDLHSDGDLTNILKTSGGTSFNQKSGFIEMAGKEVFKHAVDKMSNSVLSTLKKANLTTKDINLLVPHQANARILKSVASRLELNEDQVIITVQNHANTSAASIPLALDLANSQGKVRKGDVVVLEALGGGLTWGSIVLKW